MSDKVIVKTEPDGDYDKITYDDGSTGLRPLGINLIQPNGRRGFALGRLTPEREKRLREKGNTEIVQA